MQFYPTLTIEGIQYSSIEKPVVMALSAGAPLEFDTVEEALAQIEQLKPADPLPENIYRFEGTGWRVVQVMPAHSQG